MSRHRHHYNTAWMCFLYEHLGDVAKVFDNPVTRRRYNDLRRKFQPQGRYVELDHTQKNVLLAVLHLALEGLDKEFEAKKDSEKQRLKGMLHDIQRRLTYVAPADPRDFESYRSGKQK